MSTSSSTTLPSTENTRPSVSGGDISPQRLSNHDEESLRHPGTHDERVEKEGKEKDEFLVAWGPADQENPKNWTNAYKSWITFQLGMLALSASLGSSIISPAEQTIARYTGISSEVAVLVVALYILG